MTLNNSMSITPVPPAKVKGARFQHGSVLGGKTRRARVSSQWKSTRAPFNEVVARYLKAIGDPREVVSDPEAQYWRAPVEERSLVPLGAARLGGIDLNQWLRRSQAAA